MFLWFLFFILNETQYIVND